MRYRKKPEYVDAWEYDGRLDFSKTLPKEVKDETYKIHLTQDSKLKVETPKGTMYAEIGDMIIKNAHGEFYPCELSKFKKKYIAAPKKRYPFN